MSRLTLLKLTLLLTLVACQVDHDDQGDAGAEGGTSGGDAHAVEGGTSAVHMAAGGKGGNAAAGSSGGGGSPAAGSGGRGGSPAAESGGAGGAGRGGAGAGPSGGAGHPDSGQGGSPAAGGSNRIELHSDSGDYIGAGRNYTYTEADARFTIAGSNNAIAVSVAGDEGWTGNFVSQMGSALSVGHYGDATRWPFQMATSNGLDWSGEGRGCNMLTGSFDIDAIEFGDAMKLKVLELRFEQHCEGNSAALRGTVHWHADEQLTPAGPVDPPPSNLWQPAANETPSSGRYVYLQSDAGDYIGAGATRTYTQANAQLSLTGNAGHLTVGVTGDQHWTGDFAAPQAATQLQRGYYANLQRYPFNNPVKGGLSWSGGGRGCNTLSGWFVVDEIAYDSGAVTSLDLRFEQHCEGGSAALHGKIHWQPSDTTAPPGPVNPPPSGLWQPTDGSTPPNPRYVYLQSDAGDFIGAGGTYTYTNATAVLTASGSNGLIHIAVTGDQDWTGDFAAASSASLQPGYYASLSRYPFQNPVKGGLAWSGEGRGCNTLTGWFAIDAVTFESNTLSTLDLRFEQHCEGGSAALHGKIHWSASDPTTPPGPVNPPPSGLWAPAPGDTPASGGYVYLTSDSGDYIGGGMTMSYPITASALSGSGSLLQVSVSGWSGHFLAMRGLPRLQVGYYGDLARWPFNNPVKGGLDWSGQGRGCNVLQGWFAVDAVTYTNDAVSALDLRFEQHCEGGSAALHGKIHLAP